MSSSSARGGAHSVKADSRSCARVRAFVQALRRSPRDSTKGRLRNMAGCAGSDVHVFGDLCVSARERVCV
eukprot:6208288-Pleurochrysis_carterae.AAC.4